MGLLSKLLQLPDSKDDSMSTKLISLITSLKSIKNQIDMTTASLSSIMNKINALEDIVITHQHALEEMYKVQKTINESYADKSVDMIPTVRKPKIEKPN